MDGDLLMKQSIKDIISNRKLRIGDFRYSWQEFVLERKEKLEQRIKTDSSYETIEQLLECVNDDNLADSIRDAIAGRDCDLAYINYNRGFRDGLKLALMLGKL